MRLGARTTRHYRLMEQNRGHHTAMSYLEPSSARAREDYMFATSYPIERTDYGPLDRRDRRVIINILDQSNLRMNTSIIRQLPIDNIHTVYPIFLRLMKCYRSVESIKRALSPQI